MLENAHVNIWPTSMEAELEVQQGGAKGHGSAVSTSFSKDTDRRGQLEPDFLTAHLTH